MPPLPERMRPTRFEDLIGRKLRSHLKWIEPAVRSGQVPSMVFYGPPGSGKTSLARLIAAESGQYFEAISAVLSGTPELRKVMERAKERAVPNLEFPRGQKTIVFVDEIHRWNRAQQDALLPHVESGAITLLGATTENPSLSLNSALLSRTRLVGLETLDETSLGQLLTLAWTDKEKGLAQEVTLPPDLINAVVSFSDGDARAMLLELERMFGVAQARKINVDLALWKELAPERAIRHDRAGDNHFDVVSAFIKSMRASDPDGAIYWMMRMISGGEDPRFIARRLVIFASEDVGNADPNALAVAVNAAHALELVGLPEARHNLAQACIYLASTAKSNATYKAWKAALADVESMGALPVPLKFRNAVTPHMASEGYGQGYQYPHDAGGDLVGECGLPTDLTQKSYYEPSSQGLESRIKERLARLRPGQKR